MNFNNAFPPVFMGRCAGIQYRSYSILPENGFEILGEFEHNGLNYDIVLTITG